MYSLIRKGLFILVGLFVLSGCSAKQAYKLAYQKHVEVFKKANPYIAHKVPRGKYFLYAQEFGKQYADKGPTILLMHGFPDSTHLYDEIVPYLAKKRHVIAFDFLGWGDSDKPKKHHYTMESLKKDIEAVVDYFGLKDVVPVVHDASGPPQG